MFNKGLQGMVVLLLMVIFLTSCSSDNGGNASEKEVKSTSEVQKQEPVELTFFYSGGAFGKDQFMKIYGDQIIKKYPYISFKYIQTGTGGGSEPVSLANMIALETPIDIFFTATSRIPGDLIKYGLEFDIKDLIKKHNFDLTQLESPPVDAIREIGGGNLYGLPISIPTSKLIYNRDVFDKFGVPTPKDGMTWDETLDLAKRMTRNVDGVQYWGLVANISHLMSFNQLGASFVDPKTNKSLLIDDKWKRLVSNIVRFYAISGTDPTTPWATQYKLFGEDQTVAMLVGNHSVSDSWPKINWDLAKFPFFSDMPGVGGAPVGNFAGVASTSKHKDAAFQAIAYLTSAEYQLWASRNAILEGPVNKDPKIRAEYGKDVPYWQGRNAKALIPDKYAAPYTLTPYDTISNNGIVAEINRLIIRETADVNTALRLAAEKADNTIRSQLEASK